MNLVWRVLEIMIVPFFFYKEASVYPILSQLIVAVVVLIVGGVVLFLTGSFIISILLAFYITPLIFFALGNASKDE